jgi:AsmA protein
VINRIALVSPTVRVVRESNGRYNFTDLADRRKAGTKTFSPEAGGEKGLPLSLETDNISVRDARMTFTDKTGALPDLSLLSDIELKLLAEKGLSMAEVSGKVTMRELTIKSSGGEIKGSGTISLTKGNAADFALTASFGKDTIKVSGDVKDYLKKPAARVDVSAADLDLERLISFSEAKQESARSQPAKRGASPQKIAEKKKEDTGLSAAGDVKIGNGKFKGYLLKNFAAHYQYSDGNVTIRPVSTGLSGGTGAIIQGTAKGDLKFSVSGENAADSIKKTLGGKFTADLSRCEVKETRMSNAMAAFTGMRELASPKFDAVHFLLTLGNQKIALQGTMASSSINLTPSGTVGFDKRIDIVTDVKVSPNVAGRADSDKVTRYLKDERGWTVIPLRITGTADSPSVGLNQAGVGRQVEKGVKQEIEKRLFKGIFGK